MPESTHPNYRLQDLQRRWERDPSSRVYQQLAEEYRKSDQLVEAAVVLEDGLGRRPNDIAARVALGRCRLDLGQTPEAIEALENVLARDAAHHVANKLLLDAYLRAGDLIQARERLNIYRLLNDRDPELERLGFRLQQLAEGRPDDTAPPSPQEPEAPWASVDREPVAEASQPDLESEDAPVRSHAEDAADVLPVAAAPLEEALNMVSSTHSKANDVFDLGVAEPEIGGFAALWAELGYSLTPPSSGLGEIASSSPSPLFDGAEPPEEDTDESLAAPPQPIAPQPVAPQPALSAVDDLVANPFGQLMEPATEETQVQETADIWQTIAEQGSQPVAELEASVQEAADEASPSTQEVILPETSADSALEAGAAAVTAAAAIAAGAAATAFSAESALEDASAEASPEPLDAMADGPTVPLADLLGGASTEAETEDAPVAEAVLESAPLEDEETRPLQLEDHAAPEPAAPEPAAVEVESVEGESAQSPWEAAWQAESSTPQPAAPEPSAPEPAAPEPAAPELAAPEEPAALVVEAEASSSEETPVETEATSSSVIEEDAEATVTLGSLYLKQGHREEAARIFEKILRRSPGNQAALAGLNLARKSEMSSLSAMDLLADQSLSGTIPADVHAKKILVLSNYLQHLKAHRTENHVH